MTKIDKEEQLKKCIRCSCNKNRKCNAFTVINNTGNQFPKHLCEFYNGNKKKAVILELK